MAGAGVVLTAAGSLRGGFSAQLNTLKRADGAGARLTDRGEESGTSAGFGDLFLGREGGAERKRKKRIVHIHTNANVSIIIIIRCDSSLIGCKAKFVTQLSPEKSRQFSNLPLCSVS